MKKEYQFKEGCLSHTRHHIHTAFSRPYRVISSAALNGGIVQADHIVNLKVPQSSATDIPPETTLSDYCRKNGWNSTAVGMMTAASMDSFRLMQESVQGVEILAMATAGLSNPRRAGDPADYSIMGEPALEQGTINIIVITNAILLPSALVESTIIVTEAKAAALQELQIKSGVSDGLATGTGTDAMAIASGYGPTSVRYSGKHVLFGEMIGRLVKGVVSASLQWELKRRLNQNS